MGTYVVGRLLAIIPTVLLLVLFVVVLTRLLPGDAVDILLAERGAGDAEVDRSELEERLGLDKSLPEDYISYVSGLARGDLGRSMWTREPILDQAVEWIGVTMELGVLALIVGSVVGIAIGIVSASFQNNPIDLLLRSVAILGLSVPNFALGTAVIVLPVIWWGWSPPLIYRPVADGIWPHVSQFFVPALVLGFGLSATLMRITRTMMLEVLRMDYIRTARAKGLNGQAVVLRHGLRNALIPVVSLLGVQVAFVLSGAVVIENIFGLPGIGRAIVTAINTRDYTMIQGLTVISGLIVIVANLAVDVSYGVIDPRTR